MNPSRRRKYRLRARVSTNSYAALKASKHPLAHLGRCALSFFCCCHASAQVSSSGPVLRLAESRDPRDSAEPWVFSGSLYAYFPPDSGNYLQPTLTADREWLHLEVRYNYEARDSVSAWLGYNFSGGERVEWHFSPMLGGVFGKLAGVAPGYEGSLRWRRLELYSEGEYVIDFADSSASFFYNWSELTLSPLGWLRIGMVAQRTHVYHTDREIQRGLLVRFSYERVELTANVLNPDDSNPTFVIAFRVSW